MCRSRVAGCQRRYKSGRCEMSVHEIGPSRHNELPELDRRAARAGETAGPVEGNRDSLDVHGPRTLHMTCQVRPTGNHHPSAEVSPTLRNAAEEREETRAAWHDEHELPTIHARHPHSVRRRKRPFA